MEKSLLRKEGRKNQESWRDITIFSWKSLKTRKTVMVRKKKRGEKVNDPKIFCPANDYESSNTSSGDNSTCRNNGDFNWGGRCCSNEFVDAAAPNDADGDNDDNEKEKGET